MLRRGDAEEQCGVMEESGGGGVRHDRAKAKWNQMRRRGPAAVGMDMKTQGPRMDLLAGDALVLVDVQNDFLPGGTLPVPRGDAVVPLLNRYLAAFAGRHLAVYATRDWHPPNHCSFQTQGGRWPIHCVADSQGAQFASELILPPWTVVISKGIAAEKEPYSGFEGTDLERRLRGHSARRIFIGGLATDYGVLNTVKDGLARGFSVFLLCDAICAVNVKPDDGRNAEAEMLRLRAVPIQFKHLNLGRGVPASPSD